MTDYIKKEQEDETIIDSGKVYDELRHEHVNRSFLFPCSDEKKYDDFHPFSDEAYNKRKSWIDKEDNLDFKNKLKHIKKYLSTPQEKEVKNIIKATVQ